MQPRTAPQTAPQTAPATAGPIARRIADRRAVLGLGPDALARAAGMSRPYLDFLVAAGPGFDPNGFLRIAAALGLTYRELVDGLPDRPPGQGSPAPRPVLARLTEAECWERVDARGVGRIALPGEPEPRVFPVNYTVDRGSVVYRTHERGAAAAPPGTAVSFEVDRIDDHRRSGWSVLITGTAERIEDRETLQRLMRDLAVQPWAGGPRTLWIRVRPTAVTGRRITSTPIGDED